MHRRGMLLGLIATAFMTACSREAAKTEAPPSAQAPDPVATIRPLYDRYLTEGAQFPSFRDQAPWSADLWSKLDAAIKRAPDEPVIDFDPLIGAQDFQISNLNVTTDSLVPNSHAVVRAHFTNINRDTEIVYDMVWEGGAWRVDNIRGTDFDLRQIASQT